MNLLWVHDQEFIASPSGSVYSRGQFPYEIWLRYLAHFKQVNVISCMSTNTGTKNIPSNCNISSGPCVNFNLVPKLSFDKNFLFHKDIINKIIAEEISRADAVICRLPSFNGQFAIQILRSIGKPYIVELVGCPWDAFFNHGSLLGKLVAPYISLKTRAIVCQAFFVIYVTRFFLQRRYPTNGYSTNISNVHIPSVVNVEALQTQGKSSFSDPITLGIIASLKVKYKGVQVAIKALAFLRDKGYDTKLKILGPGDSTTWKRIATEYRVEDSVDFCGTLPAGEQVLQWLDSIDIYLQPSYQEGLPRALIEAMSRGRPALGSTAGGIPELLPAECLHKPGDWRTLAAGVEKISSNIVWRDQLVRQNLFEAEKYLEESLSERRKIFFEKFISFIFNHYCLK
jgi:glycosyltransferase involved in cell wall biosynthesis